MFSRAKRLFDYGNLDHDSHKVSASTSAGGSVTIEKTSLNTSSTSSSSSFIMGRRKWIVLISSLCLLASLCLIAVALSTQSEPTPSYATSEKFIAEHNLKEVGLEDVTTKNQFWPRHFNGSWISDHEIQFYDRNRGIYLWDVNTLSKTHVLSGDVLHPGQAATKLSSDQKYLLIESNYHSLYRASSFAEYRILDLQKRSIEELKPNGSKDEHYFVRLVSWAPKGNALVYVDMDNNIHYRASALAQDRLITNSGVDGKIFNGIPDWVFEEEIFESNSALWWSPDGTKLVWGTFNDTKVEAMILQAYGKLSPNPSPLYFPYPKFEEPLRYPKVGTRNPSVSLWLADFNRDSGMTVRHLPSPSSLNPEEVHFSRVTWIDSTRFAVDWMNRVQNRTVLSMCGVGDLDCTEIFQRQQENGWIQSGYKVLFNPKENNIDFFTILPDDSSPFLYRQIYRILGDKQVRITNSDADVVELISWNKSGFLYYTSTLPQRSTARHFFRIWIPDDMDSMSGNPECLSCSVPEMEYLKRPNCSFFDVKMSADGSFYILDCKGPIVPWISVHQSKSLRFIASIESNKELEDIQSEFALPTIEFIRVPVPGSEQKANVKLIYPPGFDPKEAGSKRLPLLVEVYGGPGFLKVKEEWNYNEFYSYFSGSHEIVTAVIDPRGSGYQGDAWKFAQYRNLGQVEAHDVLHITSGLLRDYKFLDEGRTAIWGWSYGAFLTLKVLTGDESGVFSCGASVAPVVDWRLYDTYYTERFMGLPYQDNEEGYNQSSVYWNIDRLREKKFFLMHGTKDDNVHFQQSLMLSATLEDKDILFRQQVYTDQNHGIHYVRKHLYHTLTDFFVEDCFGQGLE
eukprot:TRINITY_DN689_c1_g1_i3.p1 TRINITY_DN689_c1_g1~~TRINITY_DN689_c1_g1_i3.p1  ORF type:complete len:850 (-),score=196.30 TRINITY_DN689_c1_g1_i3:804-3353(-)